MTREPSARDDRSNNRGGSRVYSSHQEQPQSDTPKSSFWVQSSAEFTIIGRLGRDPEWIQGVRGCKLQIGTKRIEQGKPTDHWFYVTIWGEGRSEMVIKQARKGDMVKVQGDLTTAYFTPKGSQNEAYVVNLNSTPGSPFVVLVRGKAWDKERQQAQHQHQQHSQTPDNNGPRYDPRDPPADDRNLPPPPSRQGNTSGSRSGSRSGSSRGGSR